MITKELISPKSIVVIGGSNNIHKPGGKILKNILDGQYKGDLFVVNPKEKSVQGILSFQAVDDLPKTELAIIAIAAPYILETVKVLALQKATKAFIILSAGFSELNDEGRKLEREIVKIINSINGSLIGPNCIGVMLPDYHGVFTEPIPKLDAKGCDFISGSGATACFILESALPKGLTFSSVFSVGNSPQLGVEEILEHLDESFDPATSSKVKLLYIENIAKPELLLKHASSLIKKGCKIAAIKAGSTEAGSRAASSHTGALASPDLMVEALLKKAGIVRCYGREELISVATVFMNKELNGKNIAIITHAGGPAVMLTDELSKKGLKVPGIEGLDAIELLKLLHPGSSVNNPIDFLATGTAEQLESIIDYVDQKFNHIDAMVVIFGTPGLVTIDDVYEVLNEKMNTCKKPIYPVLPSTLTAAKEMEEFRSKGRVHFTDEVALGNALAKVYQTPKPAAKYLEFPNIDQKRIREIISASKDGYLPPESINGILDACGISRSQNKLLNTENEAVNFANKIGYPLVMKVVGPIHKSDVGGVVLNIDDEETVLKEFNRLKQIKDTYAVLMYPMYTGTEIFIGAKHEEEFGHIVLCGLGGIFVEVLKDIASGLTPINKPEALKMIKGLKGYEIIKGIRNQEAVSEDLFVEVIVRVALLVEIAPEIVEMDLNPLFGKQDSLTVVDARIRIEKNKPN